jgi:membrane protein implicated in regulation of membrane protease activity
MTIALGIGATWNLALVDSLEMTADPVDEPLVGEADEEATELVEELAETAEEDEAEEVTELLEQLAKEMTTLVACEAQLAASRHKPELRRAARDAATALVTALAFLTAFGLANAAAVEGLRSVVSAWLAPLVLAGAWAAVGAVLALALLVRARRAAGPPKDLEKRSAEAEEAVRETLGRLIPAISKEIASEALPMAGDLAGGLAGGVLDAGGDLLENSDEVVESITEDLPGGGIVNRVVDVALMPGRYGVRVATTVLKRGGSSS